MNGHLLSKFSAAILTLVIAHPAFCGESQGAGDIGSGLTAQTNTPAQPRRLGRSPVETFRMLLAMQPEERMSHLQMYPPGLHERMIAKLQEYQALPEELREIKLQVTELRWYLMPLLKSPDQDRESRIAAIPEPYRTWVAERLDQWDMMPPSLKEEMLEYESVLDRFVSGNVEVSIPPMPDADPDQTREQELKLRRWQSLPLTQRQQIYGSLKHYLDLSEAERARTLQSLSERERAATARALEPIEKLSRREQEQYVAAFQRYAEMSANERQQFLRNAQRWQRMSPPERRAWRDLVRLMNDTPPPPPDGRTPSTNSGGVDNRRTNPIVSSPQP